MKLTISETNKTISLVQDFVMVQNSSGEVYDLILYGIAYAAGKLVRVTFTRPDGVAVGPVLAIWDDDGATPTPTNCYVVDVPADALLVEGNASISIQTVLSTGVTSSIVKAGFRILPNDSLILPEDLTTDAYNTLVSSINALSAGKLNITAIVGTAAEISAGITNNTQVYSKAKEDQVLDEKVDKTTGAMDALDVNGNGDISGDLEVHGGLIVHGPSNLSSLEIGDEGIDMDGAKVYDMADGTNPQDAVNKSQLDTKANLAGGNVILGEQDFAKEASDRYRVFINETAGTLVIYDTQEDTSLVIISPTGINMRSKKITNVANGSADGDAVNIGQFVFSLGYKQDVSEKNQPSGYVGLGSTGKIALSQIPNAAINDRFIAANLAALTSLSEAEKGDMAFITSGTDKGTYFLVANPYSTAENWQLMPSPTDAVVSINGESGVVTLDADDIPTDEVGQTVQDALDIHDGRLDTAETDINTIEQEQVVQDDRLGGLEVDVQTISSQLASTNLVNAKELLSRQQPFAEITKASPTADDANKMAYLNEIEIHGQTVKNLLKNGNISQGTTGFTTTTATISAKDGALCVLASAQNGGAISSFTLISGNVYALKYDVKSSSIFIRYVFSGFTVISSAAFAGDNAFNTVTLIKTANATSGSITFYDSRSSGFDAFYIKNLQLINLTTLGTHPTLGVAWSTLTANQLASYIGNLSVDGTTTGLHSFTPKEVHANTGTPNKAEIKVLRGRTRKQLIENGGFSSAFASPWTASNCGTPSLSGGIVSFTASAQYGSIYQNVSVVNGRKYYAMARYKSSVTSVRLLLLNGVATALHTGSGDFANISVIGTATASSSQQFGIVDYRASGWDEIQVDYLMMIDLDELGLAHLTTTAEVESALGITGYVPFGISNSKPNDIYIYNSGGTQVGYYDIDQTEFPTDAQTYGMATLPNGYGDFIKASAPYWNSVDKVWEERASYVRNVGHVNLNGATESTWAQNASGTNTYYYQLPSWISNSIVAIADTTTALSNRFVQANVTSIDTEGFMIGSGTVYVRILKTKVNAMSGADTLAKFKAWLASNNLYVAYLRTATEHDLTTFPTRITAVATDYTSITGALNPLTACELFDRYTAFTTLSGVGELRSLPDGKDDLLASYVDDTTDSTTFNQRITKITRVTEKIVLPTSAVTNGWFEEIVGGTNTSFGINLSFFKTAGVPLEYPVDNDTIANAYTSSVYALSAENTLNPASTVDSAGICIASDGTLYLVLPNTTADTLAELYTYLVANPLVVVIERTPATETEVIDYIQQSDLAMTVAVQSSTLSKEADWNATYCRDLTHIINGLL